MKKKSNFLVRSISAIIFGAVMIGGVVWNKYSLLGLVLLINFLLLYEFFKLPIVKKSIISIVFPIFSTFILAIVISSNKAFIGSYSYQNIVQMVFAVSVLLIIPITFFVVKNEFLKTTGVIYFSIFYISLPLLLFFNLDSFAINKYSFGFKISLLAFVWINDMFAYIVGSKMGRHKFAPNISPKKTWEGVVGGTFFTLVSSYVFMILFKEIVWYHWIALAFIASFFGTIGDLVESKIKREINIKDTGSIMPGHGGLLDRFDAMLLVVPFYFIYIQLFKLI